MIYLAPLVVILAALVVTAMIVLPVHWAVNRDSPIAMVIVGVYLFALLYLIVLSALLFN